MRSKLTFSGLLLLACFAGRVHAQYMYTFAGNGTGAHTGTGTYTGDGGVAKAAGMYSPTGVAFDGAGNIYIADRGNNVVRKVTPAGMMSTFAGTGTAGYSGDYGPATAARLNKPFSVATDVYGNIYIADNGNNVIRKVSTSGWITTYAGTGSLGFTGDMGPATAATFNNPQGIVLDTSGNMYIADAGNNAIRQITPGGGIFTIAGDGIAGYSGDGGYASAARFDAPVAIAVDPYGTLYIADYFNSAVRKIDTAGIITTFAGNGLIGNSGDYGPASLARFHYVAGVTVYGFGNVFISDQGNNTIRMVNAAGTIVPFAGSYTNGFSGDGGLAVTAQLGSPRGITVDALNRLFIADYDNNVIRVVQANTAVNTVAGSTGGLSIYPNPSNGSVTIEIPASGNTATVTVTDVLGRVVSSATTMGTTLQVNGIPAGNYIVKVSTGEKVYREQIVVQ